jgi:endogenous inhibitor of DNA gyrase (YacG/DUF329 family)
MIKVPCPICQRLIENDPVAWPKFPFCSRRCQTIDLGRWLGEEYRMAAELDAEAPEDLGDATESP